MLRRGRIAVALAILASFDAGKSLTSAPVGAYSSLLSSIVHGATVDYAQLKHNRRLLDEAIASFDTADTSAEPSWPRAERFAFWINAYNAFTIAAIIDHYPIRGRWLSLAPRNSIKQIDGVWTKLTWKAAGREVTLDQIEHEILRPTFRDSRVHFAINCASRSCPPIRPEPYVAERLDAQLDEAARRYLASPFGLQVEDRRLKVSSIFKWYAGDFVPRFAAAIDERRSDRDRGILGVIATYGPPDAVRLAKSGDARIEFLSYDWSLNDRER